MTLKDEVINAYFEWMCSIVETVKPSHGGVTPHSLSHRKLLMHLHDKEFIFLIPKDENRADDGIDLRRRFALFSDYTGACRYLTGPCSILEMMVALAIRCEETIMDEPLYGDRTKQWFWGMIANLGLSAMTDDRFDRRKVDDVLERFLYREYDSDGSGGLFRIKNCDRDLRRIEIWYQLCWYLDSIT